MKWKHVSFVALLAVLQSLSARADDLDLQRLIGDAIVSRQAKVVIPAGVHRIAPKDKRAESHLAFKNVQDLEIDGTGATLIFTDPEKTAISFDNVDGLTLRGFTVDYDPLPYTQGTITAIGTSPPSYDVKLDTGYPANEKYFTTRIAAYIYEPVGRKLKDGAFDHYVSKTTQPTPGVFHLEFDNGDVVARSGTAVGDQIIVSRRAATAIRIFRSKRVNVDGVTFYTAPGMALHEAHGDGGNRYRFTMTYGPKPEGATAERLHTATADGVHSSYMRVGPTVENCHIEGHGDDAIAIHDNYCLVSSDGAADHVVLAPKYDLPMEVGDEVRFLDQETYGLKSTAKIVTIEKMAAPSGEEAQKLAALWQKYKSDVSGKSFYKVTLDKPVTIATGDLASSFERTGAHFVVRNNYIGPHRARGILIKAPFGVVENNTIEGSSFCGILLGPELTTWLGGDYAAGVTVRNNVIRRVGYCGNVAKSPTAALLGAISVQAKTLNNKLAANYENAGVVIEGNLIEQPAVAGIFVSSAKDAVIRNNRIYDAWSFSGATGGTHYGVRAGTAIFISQAKDIVIAGNTVTPTNELKAVAGPATSNVQIDSGK